MVLRPAVARGRALDHQVLNDAMPPVRDCGEHFVELLRLQRGKKTKPPQIHSKHGPLAKTHLMRGAKDRAVAAEDDGQIGLRSAEVRREIQRYADDGKMPLDNRPQPVDCLSHLLARSIGKDDGPPRVNVGFQCGRRF